MRALHNPATISTSFHNFHVLHTDATTSRNRSKLDPSSRMNGAIGETRLTSNQRRRSGCWLRSCSYGLGLQQHAIRRLVENEATARYGDGNLLVGLDRAFSQEAQAAAKPGALSQLQFIREAVPPTRQNQLTTIEPMRSVSWYLSVRAAVVASRYVAVPRYWSTK